MLNSMQRDSPNFSLYAISAGSFLAITLEYHCSSSHNLRNMWNPF